MTNSNGCFGSGNLESRKTDVVLSLVCVDNFQIYYFINFLFIMWDNMIEYLKDPLLVVKVQNFFGVKYKSNQKENDSSEILHSDRHNSDEEECSELKQHKRIPSDTSSSSQCSCDTNSSGESVEEDVVCHVNNKFWYYLFVLGTELGDELFYATFIPFWFWNVDGAVGRRVVLVWTVVMYIGKFTILIYFDR